MTLEWQSSNNILRFDFLFITEFAPTTAPSHRYAQEATQLLSQHSYLFRAQFSWHRRPYILQESWELMRFPQRAFAVSVDFARRQQLHNPQ